MSRSSVYRLIAILLLITVAITAYLLDIGQYLTLDYVRAQQGALQAYQAKSPLVVMGIFFCAYIAVTALSLPGATIMTLSGGAIFGFWSGLILISFASSIGATLAFLLARFLFRDWIQQRYQAPLATLNAGFEQEGAFYLFALRLVPLFPFFIVNILMSLMPIKTRDFYAVSQLGMLPGTAVYVYAGGELGKLQSLSDITSPQLIAAFVLLGLFPIITKRIITMVRNRRTI